MSQFEFTGLAFLPYPQDPSNGIIQLKYTVDGEHCAIEWLTNPGDDIELMAVGVQALGVNLKLKLKHDRRGVP